MINQSELVVIGVAVSPHKNDGVIRFERNCKNLELDYIILGEGKQWNGGDMNKGIGGGQKINELKIILDNMPNQLIIVCDTFDLFPVATKLEILEKYRQLCPNNQILFASEVYCWPDKHVAAMYPRTESVYKYLNSGSFIGYVDDIKRIITDDVNDIDDDQRFYTSKFLHRLDIKLDYNCDIFQALNGATDHIIVHKNRIYNKYTKSYPIFIHGNGPSKNFLNFLENYIETSRTPPIRSLINMQNTYVYLAIYIDSSITDKFINFMDSVLNLQHNNLKIVAFDTNYTDTIANYMYQRNIDYHKILQTEYNFEYFINDEKYDYYFLLEQNNIITKNIAIENLINMMDRNHRIISPMLREKNNDSMYSNFWGAIRNDGYYSRSIDYKNLLEREIQALWNVPYISGAIMFHRDIITNWNLSKKNKFTDRDMNLCENIRKYGLFMYMSNLLDIGYLIQN